MTIQHTKKSLVSKTLLLLILVSFLFIPTFVFAEETFVFLTEGGIPGVDKDTNFEGFLNLAFKIGLAVAATLAVVMITIGGFQYMTTDSIGNKTEGRNKIQDAIIGLLIALLIWLILFTINPDLLKFNLDIDPAKKTEPLKKPTVNTNKAGGSHAPEAYPNQ